MEKIIFTFPGNELLGENLVKKLNCRKGELVIRSFPDGETYLRVKEDVLGKEAIVVCTLNQPDKKIIPLFFFLRNLQDLGAGKVTLIAPYLPYMRQDIRFNPGEAVSSQYFAELISSCADELITVDPHLHRIQSLGEIFSLSCNMIPSAPFITGFIRNNIKKPLIIGPDSESKQWVSEIAKQLNAPFTVQQKTRKGDREVVVSDLKDLNIQDFTPVIVDDIISTARTLIETVNALKKAGIQNSVCIGIHGIFADNAYEDLKNSGVSDIITTNTILHPSNKIDINEAIVKAIED